MTQHDPKDVEALIEAFDRYELHRNDSLSIGSYDRLKAARAKLKPKPEKVYVLPPTDAMTVELRYWYISNNLDEREWDTLREVTATDAPASKWNMPLYDELHERFGSDAFITIKDGCAIHHDFRTFWNKTRNKIMGL